MVLATEGVASVGTGRGKKAEERGRPIDLAISVFTKKILGPSSTVNSILLFLSFPLLAHIPVLFDSPFLLSLFLETVVEPPQRSLGSDWTSALCA